VIPTGGADRIEAFDKLGTADLQVCISSLFSIGIIPAWKPVIPFIKGFNTVCFQCLSKKQTGLSALPQIMNKRHIK